MSLGLPASTVELLGLEFAMHIQMTHCRVAATSSPSNCVNNNAARFLLGDAALARGKAKGIYTLWVLIVWGNGKADCV